MEPSLIDELAIDESDFDESKWGSTGEDEEGFWRWGNGKLGGYEFRKVVAVEVHLEAVGGEPLFADPELRRHLYERAVHDSELRACCVLPDGMRLIYDKTADLLMLLWSLRVQTEEYAELWGAPQAEVWEDALRLRPLNSQEEVVERAASLLRLPVERGLAASDEPYEFVTTVLHDEDGRFR